MKQQIKKLIKEIPFVKKKIHQNQLSKKFKTELDLLYNRPMEPSEEVSVIHFSVNKSATQHVKGVMRKLAEENNLIPVAIQDYAFESNMPFLDRLTHDQMEPYKHIFKTRGYLYSMFSGMVDNIDDFVQYRVVLSIRDPRDILVSNYFSIAHSHVEPPLEGNKRKVFLEKRAWAQGVSIDEFVLKDAERLHAIFDRYRRSLSNYSNLRVVKYEDMIDNYREWLLDLTQKTGLKISDALTHQLIDQNNKTKPKQEDKLAHNRKGIAGDHKEKLKQETIDQLNDHFRDVLLFFQYDV